MSPEKCRAGPFPLLGAGNRSTPARRRRAARLSALDERGVRRGVEPQVADDLDGAAQLTDSTARIGRLLLRDEPWNTCVARVISGGVDRARRRAMLGERRAPRDDRLAVRARGFKRSARFGFDAEADDRPVARRVCPYGKRHA